MQNINALYVLLNATQDEDLKVTCKWDFSKSCHIDGRNLTKEDFDKIVVYAPDPDNALFTSLPTQLKFTTNILSQALDEPPTSKLYTTTNGYFIVSELLEIIRSFIEQEYNKVFSDKKYNFHGLYFTGATHTESTIFELKWENTNQSMLQALGHANVLGGLNNGGAFGQLMDMMMGM